MLCLSLCIPVAGHASSVLSSRVRGKSRSGNWKSPIYISELESRPDGHYRQPVGTDWRRVGLIISRKRDKAFTLWLACHTQEEIVG